MTKSLRKSAVVFLAACIIAAAFVFFIFSGNIAFADEGTQTEYSVTWQYYESGWVDWDDKPATITFMPGEAGNRSGCIRAKLTEKEVGGAETGTVKYAYVSGITSYKDATIDNAVNKSDYISSYVVSFKNHNEGTFQDAGAYEIELTGNGEVLLADDYVAATAEIQKLNMNKLLITTQSDEQDLTLVYNGLVNKPENVKIYYDGVLLGYGKDYEYECSDKKGELVADPIEGGEYIAVLKFKTNYIYNPLPSDEIKFEYTIVAAKNEWVRTPYVVYWTYGDFDPNRTVIVTSAKYDNGDKTYATIVDSEQQEITAGGETLTDLKLKPIVDDHLVKCYKIDDTKYVNILKTLSAGQYYLKIRVEENASYSAISETIVGFNISKATNTWETPLTVTHWETGKFDPATNIPSVSSRFGEAVIRIKNADGDVIYTSTDAGGADILKNLHAGQYLVEATVAGTNDYNELHASTMLAVFSPDVNNIIVDEGMPWWGVLLVAIGVLMAAAIVLFALHMFGILHIYTGNAVMAMRKKADNDALIAAVRAGRMGASDSKKDEAKPEEKPEEKPTETPAEEKPEEKQEEKVEEKAEEAPAEEKPEEKPTENPAEEKPEDKPEAPQKKKAAPKKSGAKAGNSNKKPKTEE